MKTLVLFESIQDQDSEAVKRLNKNPRLVEQEYLNHLGDFLRAYENLAKRVDPVSDLYNFVIWVNKNYPPGTKRPKSFVENLEKCVNYGLANKEVHDDPRMIDIFIVYGQLLKDPTNLFGYLYDHDIGRNHFPLYTAYSAALEKKLNLKLAQEVLVLGCEVSKGHKERNLHEIQKFFDRVKRIREFLGSIKSFNDEEDETLNQSLNSNSAPVISATMLAPMHVELKNVNAVDEIIGRICFNGKPGVNPVSVIDFVKDPVALIPLKKHPDWRLQDEFVGAEVSLVLDVFGGYTLEPLFNGKICLNGLDIEQCIMSADDVEIEYSEWQRYLMTHPRFQNKSFFRQGHGKDGKNNTLKNRLEFLLIRDELTMEREPTSTIYDKISELKETRKEIANKLFEIPLKLDRTSTAPSNSIHNPLPKKPAIKNFTSYSGEVSKRVLYNDMDQVLEGSDDYASELESACDDIFPDQDNSYISGHIDIDGRKSGLKRPSRQLSIHENSMISTNSTDSLVKKIKNGLDLYKDSKDGSYEDSS